MINNRENGENTLENISYEGIIIKSTGGLYTVEKDDGTSEECRAKGAFRHSKITPLAGDRVTFECADGKEGFITKIRERKNSLIRPAVANVDLLCVVIASKNPDPDLFILDKLCAVAKNNGIEVLIIVNKDDIGDSEEIFEVYEKAGFMVVPMCATDPDGYEKSIETIRNLARNKISFFTGASGVGKSSVLNVVYPELCLKTGEISKKIRRGKHTTRVTTLFKMGEDTYVGDTPGFSSFDVVGFSMLDSEVLLSCFPDIEKHALDCKYKKCTHICEDGCNVMKALANGEISPSRHESYKQLFNELKEVKPWDN
ncbi:MAG: ribosome small subunit-dependent GTPase A [Clostridia bacterium]|nr:ribosome small subunit-dependent GTPase A [Clostridia bacterium]